MGPPLPLRQATMFRRLDLMKRSRWIVSDISVLHVFVLYLGSSIFNTVVCLSSTLRSHVDLDRDQRFRTKIRMTFDSLLLLSAFPLVSGRIQPVPCPRLSGPDYSVCPPSIDLNSLTLDFGREITPHLRNWYYAIPFCVIFARSDRGSFITLLPKLSYR